MSQENVERTREAYAALAKAMQSGDLDAFFHEFMHPDVEWIPLEGALDVAVASGHEPVKSRLVAMLEVMGQPEIEVEEIIDADEKVVAAIRISGRGRGSGIDVEVNWFHVLTPREDKLLRIEWYATREQALEAAGLSE